MVVQIGYFPGCSLQGSSREFEQSLKALAEKLGVSLEEIPDWNCCGASAAHNLNNELGLALPARILIQAERAGLEEILVPCAACFSRLASTVHELNKHASVRRHLADVLGAEYGGKTRPINILEFLGRFFPEGQGPEVIQPLACKVACYYGCLLVRPTEIVGPDRPEDPQEMDRLMSRVGAEPIDWAFKVDCCGAGLTIPRPDLVARLSGAILEDATSRGAQIIVLACPMCHTNLDMRRADIERFTGKRYTIPAIYVTQAIAYALGVPAGELGLKRHLVPINLEKLRAGDAGPASAPATSQ